MEDDFATHPLNSALQYWRDIDLDGQKAVIDAQALQINQNVVASAESRKQLAEITRAFKTAPNEEKMQSFLGVLKAFF